MNEYDKDMSHERELIYDAKKQKEYHPGDTSDDDKLIYDAKKDIHDEDMAKHDEEHGHNASVHKVLKHSWQNKGINFDSSTDKGISTLYTGERT